MKLVDFINEKKFYIILTIFFVITCEILLLPFKKIIFLKIYIGIIPIIIILVSIIFEYYKKKVFYNKLEQNIKELKYKYLISEIINTPDFLEGKILKEMLQESR